MERKNFNHKAWGGVTGKVIGKCKYCLVFSLAEVMEIDPVDKRPYHKQCEEKHKREVADATINLSNR